MGLFFKNLEEKISKYFKEENIELKTKDSYYYFDIYFENTNFRITPYFRVLNDNLVDYKINIKKYDDITLDLLKKVNKFNLESEFFKAIIKDNLLYLEYKFYLDGDEKETFGVITSSINNVSDLINEF